MDPLCLIRIKTNSFSWIRAAEITLNGIAAGEDGACSTWRIPFRLNAFNYTITVHNHCTCMCTTLIARLYYREINVHDNHNQGTYVP